MDARMPRRSIGGDESYYDGRRLAARRSEDEKRGGGPIRFIIILLVIAAILLVIALVGFLALSSTSAFTITSIDATDTEHLTADNIAKLAHVEEGTTLLNIDEELIAENIKRNPWVGEVSFVREFPDKLKIEVTERSVESLVKMSSGSVCWSLGNDNVWIEPVNLSTSNQVSSDNEALMLAQQMDAILITDVPTSVSPSAGSQANDEVLKAIATYRELLSDEFAAEIVRFSAPSVESISCTLKSGVEVSLGAPTDIDVKEAVVKEILKRHPNQVTYINVRVPSQPSYRKLGVETVTPGSGVTVDETSSTTQGTGGTTPDATTTQTDQGDGTTEGEDPSSDEAVVYDEYATDDSYDETYYDDSSYDEYDYSEEYYDESYGY